MLTIPAPPAPAASSLFVANGQGRNVSAYAITPGGAPIQVAGSPFAVGVAPVGVAMTPDAAHLYVTNFESKGISAFTVGSDGGLSPVPGSPFATGAGPWGAAVSPDGAHLYVANNGGSSVSGYSISSDGSLSPLPGSPFPIADGSGANGIAIAPDGAHLYVTAIGGGSVSAFSIAADGGLSPVPGSPYELGGTLRGISVTSDGRFLYVANTSHGNIAAFSIAAVGSLTPVSGSPFEAKGSPLGLAVSPDGTHLYMAHVGFGDSVWAWSIGSAGELTPIPGSPFPTGGLRGNSIAISPSSTRLYTTNSESGDVTVYSIGSGGSLSFIPGSPFAAGFGPLQLVVTPDQGPTAAFSATPMRAGNPSSFDASASSDPDGSVASYHWDFGDGQTAVTSTSTAVHKYISPGEYTVALTVTDDAGCSTARTFTGQTVSCNGSPLAQIAHDLTVPPGVPLDVSVTGSGGGSVVSSPTGIACPAACSYAFEPDTEVTLTAGPATGSSFAGWSGDSCSGSQESTCKVSMAEAQAVEAKFTLDTHVLNVATTGAGMVSSNPVGVGECGAPTGNCQAFFDYGSVVTLTASPAPGSAFVGWSGGDCLGTAPCQVEMEADVEVIANFIEIPPSPLNHTLAIGAAGDGVSVPARLRIGSIRPKIAGSRVRVVVAGTIAKAARGVVGVAVGARLNGRRLSATARAQIRDGHWRTGLTLLGLDPGRAVTIKARASFKGSPGVGSARGKRSAPFSYQTHS